MQQAEAPCPPATAAPRRKWVAVLLDWLQTLVLAFILAFLIQAFVIKTYQVDGDSMVPNLHARERLLVNRLVYRLRPPRPGEMVIFTDPQPDLHFRTLVKRVIAVAGDRVEVKKGLLYINGQPMQEPYAHDFEHCSPDTEGQYGCDVPAYTVGAGELFMLGDNRPHSFDSRDPRLRHDKGAPVRLTDLQGKAIFRIFPFNVAGTLQDQPPLPATSG